jgi:predicted dehydrogenase
MKIVQIGSIGHYAYALPTAQKYGLDLCGVCYPDPEDNAVRTAKNFESFGFSPRVYDTVEEMLAAEKPDVAVINTVMSENGRYAEMALKKGISVFCEKPVSTTLEGLDRLESVYAAAKKKKPTLVFCGMFGIDYLPHFETAYNFIKAGGIGEVMLAHAQKSYRMGKRPRFYSDREKYGGTIPWVGIHAVDWIACCKAGEFASVRAIQHYGEKSRGTLETAAHALFTLDSGAIASADIDYMRPAGAATHGDDRLRAVGEKGVIEVAQGKVELITENGTVAPELETPELGCFGQLVRDLQNKSDNLTSETLLTCKVTKAVLTAQLSADKKCELSI